MLRVAFVHDWLVTFRGGEKVLEALLSLYPDAPIYTLFYDKAQMPESISSRVVHTPTLLNPLRKIRKLCLPLLPKAIESFDFSGYDLIISTSSCVAKGAIAANGAKHLCYLHSPMRYIWDQQGEYLKGVSHIPFAQWGIKKLTPNLRKWDVDSAQRVSKFVSNSSFVAKRAFDFYQKNSSVVHPPIATERFKPSPRKTGGYFLCAGAFVSYKRFDLAINACEQLGKRLIVAGSGPMESQLRDLAKENTSIEISPSDQRFDELLQNADALLFPGVEDFGMIAIESMASGTPVIAYKKGGATDFIKEGKTGIFFQEPTSQNLVECLNNFDPKGFDPEILSLYADGYNTASFLDKMRQEIDELLRNPSE